MGWSALTGGLAMVMSATPSAPTSMVTRIDPAAMAGRSLARWIGAEGDGGVARRRGRDGRGTRRGETCASVLSLGGWRDFFYLEWRLGEMEMGRIEDLKEDDDGGRRAKDK